MIITSHIISYECMSVQAHAFLRRYDKCQRSAWQGMPGRLLLVRVHQYVVVCTGFGLISPCYQLVRIMHLGRILPLRCYGLLRYLLALWCTPPVVSCSMLVSALSCRCSPVLAPRVEEPNFIHQNKKSQTLHASSRGSKCPAWAAYDGQVHLYRSGKG